MNQEIIIPNKEDRVYYQVQKLNPWLYFQATLYLLVGGLYSITIIGAVIGIPFIIAGLGLWNSAKEFKNYAESKNIINLEAALEEQRRFFGTLGWIIIITFILPLLLALSLMLAMFFSPDLSKELNDNLPKIQIPHQTNKGREV